jgi:hypothetical protein
MFTICTYVAVINKPWLLWWMYMVPYIVYLHCIFLQGIHDCNIMVPPMALSLFCLLSSGTPNSAAKSLVVGGSVHESPCRIRLLADQGKRSMSEMNCVFVPSLPYVVSASAWPQHPCWQTSLPSFTSMRSLDLHAATTLHVVSGEQWPPPNPLWPCVLSHLQPRRTSHRRGYVVHRSSLLGHLSVYVNRRSDLCFPRCFLSCCHEVPNRRRQKLPPWATTTTVIASAIPHRPRPCAPVYEKRGVEGHGRQMCGCARRELEVWVSVRRMRKEEGHYCLSIS